MGTVPLADVCKTGKQAGPHLMLFQLYVIKERDFTRKLIQGETQLQALSDMPRPDLLW